MYEKLIKGTISCNEVKKNIMATQPVKLLDLGKTEQVPQAL